MTVDVGERCVQIEALECRLQVGEPLPFEETCGGHQRDQTVGRTSPDEQHGAIMDPHALATGR